jgi:hypothetical protein
LGKNVAIRKNPFPFLKVLALVFKSRCKQNFNLMAGVQDYLLASEPTVAYCWTARRGVKLAGAIEQLSHLTAFILSCHPYLSSPECIGSGTILAASWCSQQYWCALCWQME